MTALTIALRELRDRARLLYFAAALAVLPFLASLMPGAGANRADVIAAVSSFLALALSLGSAIGLGASTVGRDLAERRLSFYFSKPVSPAAIWIGKAGASLVASLACFAIIALPAALVSRSVWPMLWMMTAGQLVVITVAGVIVLFFLSHLLSTMIRSRSVLIALDFVCAAIAAAVLVLLARMLLAGAAADLTRDLRLAVAAVIVIILAVVPIGQLARGRTDIRRSHAALSRFLWPAVFAAIALAAGYVQWVTRVTPADISAVLYLDQPPRGGRVFVAGSTRHRRDYQAAFLLDERGGWTRVTHAPWTSVAFARESGTMAWFEPVGFFPSNEVELRTDHGPTGIRTLGFHEIVLSDDGSRVAVSRGNLVTVYDLSGGRILASAGGFDGARRHAMFFVTNDLLRVIEHEYRVTGLVQIFELDVPRKKLAKTGTAPVPFGDGLMASSDGARLLLRRTRRVIDGRTAATLAQLPASDTTHAAAVLGDGRVVDIGPGARLRGGGGRDIALPGMVFANVAGELADGTLLVIGARSRDWSSTGEGRTMFVVDVDRGAILRTIRDVKGPQPHWWLADPRMVRFDARRLPGVDRAGKVTWFEVK